MKKIKDIYHDIDKLKKEKDRYITDDGQPKRGCSRKVRSLENGITRLEKRIKQREQWERCSFPFDIICDVIYLQKGDKPYSVKPGNICVLTPGIEVENSPEVYYMGEIIITNNLQPDVDYQLIVLYEYPGIIEPLDNKPVERVLRGISVDSSDPATLNFIAPVQLFNVVRFLKRIGSNNFKDAQDDTKKILEQKIIEIFDNNIQIWSREKRAVAGDIFSPLNKVLESWGFQIIPEEFSVTRSYPDRLYEIVLQFARAEQTILDSRDEELRTILSETGLVEEDILRIRAMAEQESHPLGRGLYTIVKNANREIKMKLEAWLLSEAANSAALYIKELYLQNDNVSDRETRLSQQVLISAFSNILLGVGEWLNDDLF